MKLVIHPLVDQERLAKIVEAAGPMTVANPADAAEALREIVDAEAFYGKITPQLLAAATRLQWVQSVTASLEHYMFPDLVEHSCRLTNMRGLYSDVIASQVFGYMICFARNLHHYIRRQGEARWEAVGGEAARTGIATGPVIQSAVDRAHMHLADATVGIVGLGAIGLEVARYAVAFRMRVLAVDPMEKPPPEGIEALWPLDRLPDLLAESDFVVVAAPHTPETEKMFRRARFQQMKQTGYFINIGRGVTVDLTDLAAALDAGEIAGAALDVFETEPLPSDHPLWKMENVIITPHVAGMAPRIAERHLDVLLENVRRFSQGEGLKNLVRKDKWY